MPEFKTYIHGNVPVIVEVDLHGDFISARVDNDILKDRFLNIWLDLSRQEENELISMNIGKVKTSVENYWVERASYERRSMRDQMLKEIEE